MELIFCSSRYSAVHRSGLCSVGTEGVAQMTHYPHPE
jgi:hypothetical protein